MYKMVELEKKIINFIGKRGLFAKVIDYDIESEFELTGMELNEVMDSLYKDKCLVRRTKLDNGSFQYQLSFDGIDAYDAM